MGTQETLFTRMHNLENHVWCNTTSQHVSAYNSKACDVIPKHADKQPNKYHVRRWDVIGSNWTVAPPHRITWKAVSILCDGHSTSHQITVHDYIMYIFWFLSSSMLAQSAQDLPRLVSFSPPHLVAFLVNKRCHWHAHCRIPHHWNTIHLVNSLAAEK